MSGMRCSLLTIRLYTTFEIFGSRLCGKSVEVLAIGAPIVHVHVQVGARESAEPFREAAGAEA